MVERRIFTPSEYFRGDWDLFVEVVNNPDAHFVYDADGILINSIEPVLSNFTKETGIDARPHEIDRWDHLSHLALLNGCGEEVIEVAESGWYDPDILGASDRYIFIKPVVRKTIRLVGENNNSILTSRKPYLGEITRAWFEQHLPEIPKDNLNIRSGESLNGADYKVKRIRELAQLAPWVVFLDDSVHFVEAVLGSDIENVLVVNVPLGQTQVDIEHPRLIVVGRYPEESQAMYPLWAVLREATKGK